jgi:nitroreductase
MDRRISAIFARRSVRQFTGARVLGADIAALLEAGMAAPTARNLRPWHFVVVTGRAHLEKLSEIHPHGKMLAQAGLAIVVCGDTHTSPEYWVHDCAAATENVLVAAAMLGLGSVWLGMWPNGDREDPVRHLLRIPAHMGIMSLIAIGTPAEAPEPRTQYDPSRVHREQW